MLDLLDYRRRVAEFYRTVRAANGDPQVCDWFRQQRDELFRSHPQSALDDAQKANFDRLTYYDYNPAFRLTVPLDTRVEPQVFDIDLGDDGVVRYRRFGRVHFDLPTGSATFSVFWIMGYGGGVFIPFRDTAPDIYAGTRYLYDTIKGADLGASLTEMVLDFNYAYNPSCAYNPRWVCPLSPPENRLSIPIPAGEKLGLFY
jgi:uncharacterized protein